MNTKSAKILVVDDEPDVTKYLSSLLEDNGFIALTASDGKEGMEIAGREKPDLISLDITMPNETGVRMLKNLQKNESTKNIPVIVVTGVDVSFKDFIENKQHQIKPPIDYFEKPIDREKYIEVIKKILGTS
ncbi:MAG: response regulator [Deltaproteobacteria bacterium]|nr:response regulator [Deltaproteobacteria bacterium]